MWTHWEWQPLLGWNLNSCSTYQPQRMQATRWVVLIILRQYETRVAEKEIIHGFVCDKDEYSQLLVLSTGIYIYVHFISSLVSLL